MTMTTTTKITTTSRYFLPRIFASTPTTITLLLFLTTCCRLNTSLVTANKQPNLRIVGGNDADPAEYQFFAAWGSSCGATLIHDDILLTAAHCNPLTTNRVVVGAYTKHQANEPDPVNSVSRTIEQRIVHPDYNVDSWDYDVMLLKLDAPVPSSLPKVTLNNDSSKPAARSTVFPLGLGRLAEEDGDFPDVLQEVNVRVIDSDTCSKSPMYPGWIQDSMICAGVSGGGEDACFGDSGGPLLQKDSGGNITQVGVVSYGTGCARANKPGVYHRVSASYDWIQEQICEFSSSKPDSCPGLKTAVIDEVVIDEVVVDEVVSDEVVSEEVRLYTHPEDPPNGPLGVCEGDCDRDSDCADGLFCFYKQQGRVVNVPGCVGTDNTSVDFCVDNVYRNSGASVPLRQSIYKTSNNRIYNTSNNRLRGSVTVDASDGRIRSAGRDSIWDSAMGGDP